MRNVLCSKAGRVLKVAAGVWLLAEGIALATLGGLVMTMAGVFLIVTGLAGVCFIEDAVKAWTEGQQAASPPRPEQPPKVARRL
jgi:uncharacterized membrane protein